MPLCEAAPRRGPQIGFVYPWVWLSDFECHTAGAFFLGQPAGFWTLASRRCTFEVLRADGSRLGFCMKRSPRSCDQTFGRGCLTRSCQGGQKGGTCGSSEGLELPSFGLPSEWPHFNWAALGAAVCTGLRALSAPPRACRHLGSGARRARLRVSQSQALLLEGPRANAEGPWGGGDRLLLPRPPSLPWAGAGGQPKLTSVPRSPGRVASSRRRTQQAGASPWSSEGQGRRRAGQASGPFRPPRATQGPCLREKENVLLFFSSFLSLAAASLLTHCLAATGVLWFLRPLGRNRREQGQRKQSPSVARALTP